MRSWLSFAYISRTTFEQFIHCLTRIYCCRQIIKLWGHPLSLFLKTKWSQTRQKHNENVMLVTVTVIKLKACNTYTIFNLRTRWSNLRQYLTGFKHNNIKNVWNLQWRVLIVKPKTDRLSCLFKNYNFRCLLLCLVCFKIIITPGTHHIYDSLLLFCQKRIFVEA